MKTKMLLLAVLTIVILGFGSLRGGARERQTWEYVVTDDVSAMELNRLGNEGWEAVAAAQVDGRIRIILKRAKL